MFLHWYSWQMSRQILRACLCGFTDGPQCFATYATHCKNPTFYKLNIKKGNAFEKVCFCHWQMLSSATCKMQSTKWNCSCKSKVLWHTCSYLQTTSSHFVPRSVSPSKFKILFEEMSKQWQSPKFCADADPKYKRQHPCNLNMKQVCWRIHERFKVICQFANKFGQPTMCQYSSSQLCIP